MKYVPGVGPPDAKLLVLGEAPAAREEELGIPFTGPSGQIVDDLLSRGGMPRSRVYVTNVVKIRPPGNDIKRLHEIGKSIEDFIPQLWEEIDGINPNCILALGNTALRAVTQYNGIKKYRGSILLCRKGYPKVVPSIHPAALLHGQQDGMFSWKQLVYIQYDFNRAIAESLTRDYNVPQRNLWVCRSSLDLYRFLNRNADKDVVTVDIETFKTLPLCFGLAFSRHEACSIPMLEVLSHENPDGVPMYDLRQIWKMLADFLYSNIKKNGQNLKFDCRVSEDSWMPLSRVWFDTMLGFSTIYPELPKALEFISSIMTREPYYKDEGREFDPKKDNIKRLLLYNAKDAAVEHDVMEEELGELKELGLEDFFFSRVMPLHNLYYKMQARGIRIDKDKKRELSDKYKYLEKSKQEELNELVGYSVNVNSNTKQVPGLLYGDLQIPRRKDVREDTLLSLLANVVKDPRKRHIIELILEVRKIRKTRSTYVDAGLQTGELPRWMKPDRIYTEVLIVGTETGRTSTSKVDPPVSTEKLGLSLQQLTKHGDVGADLREMFITDDGKIFIEPDYSQGESRIVCHLANEPHVDHKTTASWLFGKDPKDVVADERQLGKRTRHAGGYGMGKKRLAQIAIGDGLDISEWRAGKLLDKFHEVSPGIKNVFWKGIEDALREHNNTLWTPFGRRRQFFERWSDELLREAYAYIPQSTLSDATKFALLRLDMRSPWIEILEESHDSFLAQVSFERLDEAVAIITEEMERSIDFSKCSIPRDPLIIPCEVKIGFCWGQMKNIGKLD